MFRGFVDGQDFKLCVSIQVRFDPTGSIDMTVWSSSYRFFPPAAKMCLNPVSLSRILKPCQLQGRWSSANPVDTICVKQTRSLPRIISILLYSEIPFLFGLLNWPYYYCWKYCLKAYSCGCQIARHYCHQDNPLCAKD